MFLVFVTHHYLLLCRYHFPLGSSQNQIYLLIVTNFRLFLILLCSCCFHRIIRFGLLISFFARLLVSLLKYRLCLDSYFNIFQILLCSLSYYNYFSFLLIHFGFGSCLYLIFQLKIIFCFFVLGIGFHLLL